MTLLQPGRTGSGALGFAIAVVTLLVIAGVGWRTLALRGTGHPPPRPSHAVPAVRPRGQSALVC
jgi:hypothetical protein